MEATTDSSRQEYRNRREEARKYYSSEEHLQRMVNYLKVNWRDLNEIDKKNLKEAEDKLEKLKRK